MVLLVAAAAFVGLGMLLFIIGFAFDRQELAMLGAIVVIGVGGTGVVDGYQVKSGENTTIETQETVAASLDIGTANLTSSADLSSDDLTMVGIEFGPAGRQMYTSGTGTDTIYQYDTGSWSLGPLSLNRTLDVSSEDSSPTGVEFNETGEYLYVAGDQNNNVYQYRLSEPYNVSTATLDHTFDVSAQTTSPRGVDVEPDGTTFWVVGQDNARIYHYELSTDSDLASATFFHSHDLSRQEADPTGFDFSDQGDRFYLVGEDADTVFQYELSDPFEVGSARYTGRNHDVSTEMTRPSGIDYENDGFDLFVIGRSQSAVYQYDTSTTQEFTTQQETDEYTDVGTVSSFPLEVIVLLIGALMLISGAGEASEQGRDTPPWRRDR